MRYFAEVSYHGQNYSGWQIQPNAPTVQALIQNALRQIRGEVVEIVGSGRTDAGVHAAQQFFHMDLEALSNLQDFAYKLNSILPQDIALKQVLPVVDDAHARFDALQRSYQYHIIKHKDPFQHDLSYYYSPTLNLDLMNEGCQYIREHDDFQSFCKVKTQVNNFKCKIGEAVWKQHNEKLVFYVSANRFLRGMVRAMVGTLIDVGLGKIPPDQMKQILQGKDRRLAGPAVPPHGLTLTQVEYPKTIFKQS